MRREVRELVAMGRLPDSASAAEDMMNLEERGRRLDAIPKPVSDDEAEVDRLAPRAGFTGRVKFRMPCCWRPEQRCWRG
jgi:hypothetical protein